MKTNEDVDEQVILDSKWFDNFLSVNLEHLVKGETNNDTIELLINHLTMLKDREQKLSESQNDLLQSIVEHLYAESSERTILIGIAEVWNLLKLILDLLDSDRRIRITKHYVYKLIPEIRNALENNDDVKLHDYLMLVQLSLISVSKIKEIKFFDLESNAYAEFVEIVSQTLLKDELHSTTDSLFVLELTYFLTNCFDVIVGAWNQVLFKASNDESYIETSLSVIYSILQSEFSQEQKSSLIEPEIFWYVMKKCFQAHSHLRKRATPVLKFALCFSNMQEEYRKWWKTYLIITESLNEEQTLKVILALDLIKDLVNAELSVDVVWLLYLIQQAMAHDSRALRIEAFNCFFDFDVNRYKFEHASDLAKIICSFNDSVLIRKMLQTGKLDTFKLKFIKWFKDFTLTLDGPQSSSLLFNEIIGQKWSPIPLYYFLEIISYCQESRPKFSCDANMKTFLSEVTHSSNIVIRSAVQVVFLQILANSKEQNFANVREFLQILNCVNEKECLQRGTRTWSMISEYVKLHVEFTDAENWLREEFHDKVDVDKRASSTSLTNLVRNLYLFHDALALLDKSNYLCNCLSRVVCSFESAVSNAYTETERQDNFLKFIINLLMYSGTNDRCGKVSKIIQEIQPKSGKIMTYVLQRIEKNHLDPVLVNFYLTCLHKLGACDGFVSNQDLNKLVDEWFGRIIYRPDTSSYSCLGLMQWICEMSVCRRLLLTASWRAVIDEKIQNYVKTNEEKSFILNWKHSNDSQNFEVKSNFMNIFWDLFGWYAEMNYKNLHESFDTSVILDLILEALNLAGKENLVPIYKAFRNVCKNESVVNCQDKLKNVMEYGWKLHPHYHSSVKYWMKIVIQPSILSKKAFQEPIKNHIDELLKKASKDGGHAFKSVSHVLDEFSKIEDVHHLYPQITEILVDAFCITYIYHKDLRIQYNTMEYVWTLHKDNFSSEVVDSYIGEVSEEVRLRALNLLLKILTKETSASICVAIIESLISESNSNKKRYFGDSLFHRTKHKQLQLLLIFESILNGKYDSSSASVIECCEHIYNFAVTSLSVESHQPSIRYMLEWLLIRLLLHRFSEFESKFWKSFEEASYERIGSMCSFISVAFHLAKVIKSEKFIDMAVKLTLPWSMSQHFNARLYAQTVLVKLMNLNENVKLKYEFFESSFHFCLKHGNAAKNSVKLQEDFYFSFFHPEKHFSLQTLLWELPRLSTISRDEWIQIDLFEKFLEDCSFIRFYDGENSLSKFECSSWMEKINVISGGEAENSIAKVNRMQKKYIPSEEITADLKICNTKKNSELVVVASLIDRAPNLGGLARTCEIFAVSALVLDNLQITKNKEFTSLSITAEKHVPLIEVKQYHLSRYLKNMKEKKYCVIGIEQVTNSRSLHEFSFPSRSVIVLGNEKDGIPADLLPLLDVCVEIPQMGKIRSLNVHVSASLIIWEYAKQHILTS